MKADPARMAWQGMAQMAARVHLSVTFLRRRASFWSTAAPADVGGSRMWIEEDEGAQVRAGAPGSRVHLPRRRGGGDCRTANITARVELWVALVSAHTGLLSGQHLPVF
jgi:hypothetical protein